MPGWDFCEGPTEGAAFAAGDTATVRLADLDDEGVELVVVAGEVGRVLGGAVWAKACSARDWIAAYFAFSGRGGGG